MIRASLINIGNELLSGRTVNTNAAFMGKALKRAGFYVQRTLVIRDLEPDIRAAIEQCMADSQVVLMTGGLGPTTDDITKEVLRGYFGGEMVLHAPTLAQIREVFERRGREVNPQNVLQAHVPSSCEVIPNLQGTAPCMRFRKGDSRLYAMPGVPMEMRSLVQDSIMPELIRDFDLQAIPPMMLRAFGISESALAMKMQDLHDDLPAELGIAYLPSTEGIKIELSWNGPEAGPLKAWHRSIAHHLGKKYIYATEDLSPSEAISRYLLENGIRFATAESCTGGGIAARMVRHSGVSAVFEGGFVTYTVEQKERMLGLPAGRVHQEGEVSPWTAVAMAEAAREKTGADAAVSITGYAEPLKPGETSLAPHAWIGFADARGSHAREIPLFANRGHNLDFAAEAALVFALRSLRGEVE